VSDQGFSVTHEIGQRVDVGVGDVQIASYVYQPDFPEVESRKPYLHPLRTLDGALISAFRPWDHPWHKGIEMTSSVLSGQNFWGGKTYSHGEGYLWLDNVGRMQHERFESVATTADEVTLGETLSWITAAGERWIEEGRTLRFHGVDTKEGVWILDFGTELRNVRGKDIVMGSPTTLGRPNAGYTGLFWRGPRSWTGGEIFAADGRGGEDMMGEQSPWLAITGRHDDIDGGATVLMFAGASSADVPIKWFVRSQPFAAINPSPSFDQEVVIAPDESLQLSHRIVIASRMWTRDELDVRAAKYAL
jgi:hypothetical protein